MFLNRLGTEPFWKEGSFWLLSLLYRMAIFLRHCAYNFHLLPVKRVPAVVISVGNITCGGTGKTPLIHFLASELSKKNQVAILSRGYRSLAEKKKIPTQVKPSMKAQDVGDEPLWLAQKLPQAQVWVSANRYLSAQKAIENGANIILLDDGFQHRRLHRDIDIVVLCGESPFDNGHLLPRGHLRDFPSRLKSATFLAVMGPCKVEITMPKVVFERTTSVHLKGKKVALFCAIGNPQRFIKQVKAAGGNIVNSFLKQDHDFFSIAELKKFAQQSEADILVCTEKDLVKLPRHLQASLCLSIRLPSRKSLTVRLVVFPLKLKIQQGQQLWKQFINQIQSQVHHVARVSSYTS